MQMAQPLLSDLCSLCHAEPPKYRCPRCKTQTCSLPCYKRHQQRAACSGKRDPAAYVKKNDLSTPTGVDRDYNYLKSVERTIEDASTATSQSELREESGVHRAGTASRLPNSALAKYFEQNSITVKHAPAGMSRQKNNKTRVAKSGKVFWTIEWIHADGQNTVEHDCHGSASIGEIYGFICRAREKADIRRIEAARHGQSKSRRGMKRKRENLEAAQQNQGDMTLPAEVEPDEAPGLDIKPVVEGLEDSEHAETSLASTQAPEENSATKSSIDIETSQIASKPSVSDVQTEAERSSQRHFYLLKPMTTTSSKVLIPLDPVMTLTDLLRNQTVLEYPTIYVFLNAIDELTPDFMLEETYLKTMENSVDSRFHEASKLSDGGTHRIQGKEEVSNEVPLDANSILKMLKRDMAL